LRSQFLDVGGEARGALLVLLLRVLEDAEIGRVERGELPVHPAFDLAARSRFGRIQRRAAGELVAQIAQNGVGLPHGHVAVEERRHLAAGIEAQIRLSLGVIELTAVVLALVGLSQLLQQPDHLLHISRRAPTKNLQHRVYSRNQPRGL